MTQQLFNSPDVPSDVGIILVDHGSRFPEANEMLEEAARLFRQTTGIPIVEPAHMELAEPTLEQAFSRCVNQGAKRVVITLYFLSPGRHSMHDIPRLARKAAARFPGISYLVSNPLGWDPSMIRIILNRVKEALDKEQEP